MESSILFGIGITLVNIVISIVINYLYTNTRENLTTKLGEILTQSIMRLDPNNRYILSVPFEISDTEFDELVQNITAALDLENSKTHIVMVQGGIRMIEFS